jgi:hypothetical protein
MREHEFRESLMNAMTFHCTICEQESTRICVRCTKDTCSNHLCEKCGCCSDCCDCELRLDSDERDRGDHPETDLPRNGVLRH